MDDFNTGSTRAKQDLQTTLENIRSQAQTQLTSAQTRFALDPDNLLSALEKIGQNVDLNKIATFNQYVSAMNGVFATTQSAINMTNAAEDRIIGMQDKNMEYYVANN